MDMSIEDELTHKITSFCNDDLTIVSICGAADLGKTYLSKRIASSLKRQNYSSDYLSLDSYLMNRKKRIEMGLSGYESNAYQVKKALSDLKDLKAGKTIEVKEYIHTEGRMAKEKRTICPSDFIITEGLHIMHPMLIGCIDVSIFVYTEDDQLIKIRKDADLKKRNYSLEYSNSISQKEMHLYKKNVEPYKDLAHLHLYIKYKWNYTLTSPNSMGK